MGAATKTSFHAGHVVQNELSVISPNWQEGFLVKADNERFTAASLRCRQNLQFKHFTSSFGRLRQKKNVFKCELHVQHDYFFFIQPMI